MMSIEVRLNEALSTISHHERVIVTLQEELRIARLLVAQVILEGKIKHLPFESRQRLRQAFPTINLDGLRQALRIEGKRGRK